MRPSSSYEPNAPYRASTPVLIDFFAKEAAEQQERANASTPYSLFAGLSPRGASPSNRSDASVDAGTSSASPVTVSSLRSFLRSKGCPAGHHIHEGTIQSRLNSANLSAETLLTAIETAHDANHPLWATLSINAYERSELMNRLGGIVTNSGGFKKGIRAAAQNSNNDPQQLIANILHYLRNLRR